MNFSKEVQVGILFFVVVASLFGLTVFVGDIQLFQSHYRVTVEFEEVAGLKIGDAVLLSGVEIGKVETMRFQRDGRVTVRLKLQDGPHQLFTNSPLWITSTTPLGGKHIEIGRPPPGETSAEVPRNGTAFLVGSPPRDLSREIQGAAERVGGLAESGQEILRKVNEGEGVMGTLLNDPEVARDLRETARHAREAAEKANVGEGSIARLLNDAEAAGDLKEAIRNVKEITRKINEGEGALGKLVSDRGIGKKTEQIVDSADETLTSLRRAFRMRTFIGIDGRRIPSDDVWVSKIHLRIEPDDGKFYHAGVAILDIDRSSSYNTSRRLAKLSDREDEIEFAMELMLGWRFLDRQLSFSAGLLEGRPGGSLWMEPKALANPGEVLEQLWMRMDARTPIDNSEIDEGVAAPLLGRATVGANLRFHPRMPIATLYAGVDNLLDKPVFTFGFGLELEDRDLKNLVALLGARF